MGKQSLFTLQKIDGSARRGAVRVSHGTFQTPAFMPVATSGTMKALSFEDMTEIRAEIILGNTYHLYLRPGTEIIEQFGGLARFVGWNRPMLTDSGGYQVFSLKEINRINDDGVEFQSHLDGSRHFFTAERVMEIQHKIGADIIMAFDQCVPYPADTKPAREGVRRTYDWAVRCQAADERLAAGKDDRPALFGIVQGSVYRDLRRRSAEQIVELSFPGNAIGGLSVGEPKDEMEEMLAYTVEFLPQDKPRYLMGIGYPEDIVMAVSYGIDMFDCVLPTRSARTGLVFTSEGPLVYRNATYARDERPLDPNCECRVCRRYTRAYLRHLYNQSEITGLMLASYHSSFYYQQLMRDIRAAIEQERFDEFRKSFASQYDANAR